VSFTIEGDELRPGETTSFHLTSSKLPRLGSQRAPLADKRPIAIEDLHAAIPLIGDIDELIGSDRERSR
jgi:hypothetical protein